jgi:hypothetical protein
MFGVASVLCALLHCAHQPAQSTHSAQQKASGSMDEHAAIAYLSTEIKKKSAELQSKKIGLFDFTAIDGSITNDTKRLSDHLLEELVKSSGLQFIERSELQKLLSAQEIEQTGIIDPGTAKSSGTIASIDVMISGTVLSHQNGNEVRIKAVDVATGRIYVVVAATYLGTKKIPGEEPEFVSLHKKDPDKLELVNRSYYDLKKLSAVRPAAFILAMSDENDITAMKKDKPALAKFLKQRKDAFQTENPALFRRIVVLKKTVPLIKEFTPKRYGELVDKKQELIDSFAKRPKKNGDLK